MLKMPKNWFFSNVKLDFFVTYVLNFKKMQFFRGHLHFELTTLAIALVALELTIFVGAFKCYFLSFVAETFFFFSQTRKKN